MFAARRKKVAAALAVSLSLGAAACSGDRAEEVAAEPIAGYQVAGELPTTNAGSLEGNTTLAQKLSGRLYPGVYVPGPEGQRIPNTDLVTTQAIPGAGSRVIYTLSEEAVFSDGTPVTCSDYLLAFTAGTNPEIFGSHMPLFDDTAELTCTPGSKEFSLIFKEGRGARWRGLFEAGTVLPSHAVAAKLEMSVEELDDALYSGELSRLRPIAEVWRHGFDLNNFDPDLQVSFGPYVIQSVGEHGEVTLAANEFYYGDAPIEQELVVWPGSVDTAELAESGELMVGDLRDAKAPWFDPNAEGNRLDVTSTVGQLTEVLTFPEVGTWSYQDNRRALSRCVDPRGVAAASSAVAGIDVPVAPLHVVQWDDPLAKRLEGAAQQRLDVDIAAASALAGTEVRIGAPYPSERYAAMIEAMRASCEPAGITIVDVTGDGKSLADLPRFQYGEWGEEIIAEGTVDAVLRPIDPLMEYPAASNRPQNLSTIAGQEHFLWNVLPSIPLAAQPVTFAIDRNVGNVVPYTGLSGIGWNMNRWQFKATQP
ncbi:peptide ABC transporter [Corynebacterium sp. CNCTC7651]|nr:peptide ABC transporter [Corynebacterium sp. CNCTC7651]